ncbi:MAG: hypothetical protein IJP86_11125 [Synergistaceae bacterium]|nr:hypothetical protein [Synergistaceae bacterium]
MSGQIDDPRLDLARQKAEYAAQSESAAFNNLARTARRYVSDSGFGRYLNELWRKIHGILYRQDWFVVGLFRDVVRNPGDFSDQGKFTALKARGMKCIDDGDIEGLRGVISELAGLMKNAS